MGWWRRTHRILGAAGWRVRSADIPSPPQIALSLGFDLGVGPPNDRRQGRRAPMARSPHLTAERNGGDARCAGLARSRCEVTDRFPPVARVPPIRLWVAAE